MPNRCENNITIKAGRSDIERLRKDVVSFSKKNKEPGVFMSIAKLKKWDYDVCIALTGSKRDVGVEDFLIAVDQALESSDEEIVTVHWSSESARAPFDRGAYLIAMKYKAVTTIEYSEPGVGFSGRAKYNGYLIDKEEHYEDAFFGNAVYCKKCGYSTDPKEPFCDPCNTWLTKTGEVDKNNN